MDDAASLQKLHDIVTPGPLPWWPLAPGWYVLIAVVAIALLALLWRGWRHWLHNRYRGEALRELARIGQSGLGGGLHKAPVLLKRAALSAWPRETVAGLVGEDWHRFLDESAQTDRFQSGAGALLDRLAYESGVDPALTEQETAAVLDAARMWLKRHRVPREGS